MIGDYRYPASTPDKVMQLANSLDEQWFEDIIRQVLQYGEEYNEEKGYLQVWYPAVADDNWEGGEPIEGYLMSVFDYCWDSDLSGTLLKPVRKLTFCGKEVFTEIIQLTKQAVSGFSSTDARVNFIDMIKDTVNNILLKKRSESKNSFYVNVLEDIRINGNRLIDSEFIDEMTFGPYIRKQQKIKLNINQNALAFFLAVAKHGGAIENDREEIIEFVQDHFLVVKEGDSHYSPITSFRTKFNNFFNSSIPYDTPEEKIYSIYKKGIDTISR